MKDIKGYEGLYTITEDGEVFNAKGKKVKMSSEGKVNLFDANKKRKNATVARVMLETYVGESDQQVEYLDGNKLNVRLSNLKWKEATVNREADRLTSSGTTSEREKQFMAWVHYVYGARCYAPTDNTAITYRAYAVLCIMCNLKYKSINTFKSVIEEFSGRYTEEKTRELYNLMRHTGDWRNYDDEYLCTISGLDLADGFAWDMDTFFYQPSAVEEKFGYNPKN